MAGVNSDTQYLELAALANGAVDAPLLDRARTLNRAESSLRSSVLLSALLLRAGKPADAAVELEAARKKFGDHPAVLINLAKVMQQRGDLKGGVALARKALDAAPDDEVALGWWASAMRMLGREAELVLQLGSLQGFRPKLVLGGYHLEKQQWAQAEAAYRAALDASKASRACVELVTRDLRASDRHDALIRTVGARFDLDAHGPYVGLAIARAHAELGEVTAAQSLLEQVRAKIPAEAQSFVTQLEALLAKKRLEGAAPGERALASVPFVGPVWASPLMKAGLSLAPGSASRLVAFVQLADCTQDRAVALEGASLDGPTPLENACRSIPLALSEALTLDTTATGCAMIATHGTDGLVTFREHLDEAAALLLVSAKPVPRVVVTGFFSRTLTHELQLDLFLLELREGARSQHLQLTKGPLEELASRAEKHVKAALTAMGVLAERTPTYSRPALTPEYLEVLHHVLVLVLTDQGRVQRDLLWGSAGALLRTEAFARLNPSADTPALLLLAAHLSCRPDTFKQGPSLLEGLERFEWSKSLKV